ncbi:MAG: hypothetical protein KG012_09125 [Deltaproteobacteria bacterium]|nr:hypothetical protein [Deltaproteobacteria bacterium]
MFLKKSHRFLADQQGASFIIALLILLVLTLIGINAINTSVFETNIAGNERLYNNAFFVGDAGVDYFFGTCKAFIPIPQTSGTIQSNVVGLNLGGSRFNVNWRKIREETGPPKKVEFLVISEGVAPNFPIAGRVTIEAIIEGVDAEPLPEYPGGST